MIELEVNNKKGKPDTELIVSILRYKQGSQEKEVRHLCALRQTLK